MSKKSDLKRAIMDSEREIEELENKCRRSQTALLQSILNKTMRLHLITAPLQVNSCPHFRIV